MFAAIKSGAAQTAAPSDPYFYDVTMLLTGDGTNGAQNNTFLDSSTNNFSITRNGNTTQGTFTPYGDLWSNYFDGSGDYLSVASATALELGTGDFTIEFWVYANTLSAEAELIDFRPTGTNGVYPLIYVSSSGTLAWWINSADRITGGTLTTSTWAHVAVSRSSGSTKMFLNGTQIGSTYADTNSYLCGKVTIGMSANTLYPLNGYMADVRVVKGTAVYTSAFTPPTAPLTAISGTSLLTCQSNRFIDNSTNAFAITKNGDVSVQRFSPFNPTAAYSTATIGGSGYFDGTGDYLTTPFSTPLSLSSSDFTIECWVYLNANFIASTFYYLLAQDGSTNAASNFDFVINNNTNGEFRFEAYSGSTQIVNMIGGSGYWKPREWTHVAVTRSGSSFTLWVNGVSRATATSASAINANSIVTSVGTGTYSTSRYFNGYISDMRVVKGTAVYTTTFTPPTAPLTAVSNTSLLLSGTNAGIPDSAMMNDLETAGNAQVSTSVIKYGTGSLKFDGTGDYLVAPAGYNSEFGSGAFTVEMWVYVSSIGADQTFMFHGWAGSGGYNYGWRAGISTTGVASFYANGDYRAFSDLVVSANTWTHLAFVGSGGVLSAFKNGTKSASTWTYTSIVARPTATTVVGGFNDNNENIAERQFFNGYIDDLRITKGLARYTTTFTAPTEAFPTY